MNTFLSLLPILGWQGLVALAVVWMAWKLLKRLIDNTEKAMQGYAATYAAQTAEIDARLQRIDKLAEETAKLTDAAEKIKTQFEHELWDRQTRWIAKRDMYVRVVEAIAALRTSFLMDWTATRTRSEFIQSGKQPPERLTEEVNKLKRQAIDVYNRFCEIRDLAVLTSSDEALNVLLTLTPTSFTYTTHDPELELRRNVALVQDVLYRFLNTARSDLGYAGLDLSAIKNATSTPPAASQSGPHQPS